MQYTANYNLNVPEGTDIVNPLVQDNPNWTAIDAAMYANKLRVIGTATEVTTGTVHALTRADADIPMFRFVATSDYNTGDTFTVDGVSVTARIANGTAINHKAYVINSAVVCILDGSILNILNVEGVIEAENVSYDNTGSGLSAGNVQNAIDELDTNIENVNTKGLSRRSIGSTGATNNFVLDMTSYADGIYALTTASTPAFAFVSKRNGNLSSDSTRITISGLTATFDTGSYYNGVYISNITK